MWPTFGKPNIWHRINIDGRVADVGCSDGRSSIATALAYPKVLVDGIVNMTLRSRWLATISPKAA
jgi:hypothetical protein